MFSWQSSDGKDAQKMLITTNGSGVLRDVFRQVVARLYADGYELEDGKGAVLKKKDAEANINFDSTYKERLVFRNSKGKTIVVRFLLRDAKDSEGKKIFGETIEGAEGWAKENTENPQQKTIDIIEYLGEGSNLYKMTGESYFVKMHKIGAERSDYLRQIQGRAMKNTIGIAVDIGNDGKLITGKLQTRAEGELGLYIDLSDINAKLTIEQLNTLMSLVKAGDSVKDGTKEGDRGSLDQAGNMLREMQDKMVSNASDSGFVTALKEAGYSDRAIQAELLKARLSTDSYSFGTGFIFSSMPLSIAGMESFLQAEGASQETIIAIMAKMRQLGIHGTALEDRARIGLKAITEVQALLADVKTRLKLIEFLKKTNYNITSIESLLENSSPSNWYAEANNIVFDHLIELRQDGKTREYEAISKYISLNNYEERGVNSLMAIIDTYLILEDMGYKVPITAQQLRGCRPRSRWQRALRYILRPIWDLERGSP